MPLSANVVHITLNARGGSERLAVSTINALSAAGYEVTLTTFEAPNLETIESAYGRVAVKNIKKVRTIDIFADQNGASSSGYDITINTHGDMLPFFKQSFSPSNAVTYCHYPLAWYLAAINESNYSNMLESMKLRCMPAELHEKYIQSAQESYKKMMENSAVLTNSQYSRDAIFKTFGIDSTVLSPPVEVEAFRDACLDSKGRDDYVLVISRFHPSKKIENAIILACLLKQANIGKGMNIVGNISPYEIGYYEYLRHTVQKYGLEDYVCFETNVELSRLFALMRQSKVYLHPLPGEPFGISTVEAMSAGLVPVVPDTGGHCEFVPHRYQFHTFRQGVGAIASAMSASDSERYKISLSVQKFSSSNFSSQFQRLIESLANATASIDQNRMSKPEMVSPSPASYPQSKHAAAA